MDVFLNERTPEFKNASGGDTVSVYLPVASHPPHDARYYVVLARKVWLFVMVLVLWHWTPSALGLSLKRDGRIEKTLTHTICKVELIL